MTQRINLKLRHLRRRASCALERLEFAVEALRSTFDAQEPTTIPRQSVIITAAELAEHLAVIDVLDEVE